MFQNWLTQMTKNTQEETRNRVGVIDVGSNSVRFVVFDGAIRSPSYFYNEKVMAGLGTDLAHTGKLHPEGKERALRAMVRFAKIAERMELTSLAAVATEAVRAASDGPEFCQTVLDEIGIELVPVSGEQEARLSAQGVLLGWPQTSGLVCDIGGASMELAQLKSGDVERARSSKLGPMAVLGRFKEPEKQMNYIRAELGNLIQGFDKNTETLFLVGGSWRALAQIHMKRVDYPLRVIHDFVVEPEAILDTLKHVARQSPEALQEQVNAGSARVRLLPTAAKILIEILNTFNVGELAFSSYGLREGLMYENMSEDVRSTDPLIAAARAMEQSQARFPGFGDTLYNWILPLFNDLDDTFLRLIHTACLLHDVHWRSHPDYRSEVCFDAATHANLAGIDHGGRVFLAWSLLHRYKAKYVSQNYTRVDDLLHEDEMALAETIGYAMRLGAMMSGADPEHMGKLFLTSKAVNLELDSQSKEVFGEVVMKRLHSVATSMDRIAAVSYV
jgi:exopolyphosphatase/guanosine-5'-triphosphate,3'-diphosphate pyrophosphatase